MSEHSDHQGIDVPVIGHGVTLPFSKGLLSQSLLATGIDSADAVAVAKQIERELLASGAHEIPRHQLRELAARVLRSRMGDEIAERYLLWRRYQEPERPVIVLLAGTSGVGKTSLALEVARRLGIGRVQSTDTIREMMRIMLLPDLVPAIHASSYDAHLRLPHAAGATPQVADGFRAQAAAVSIGVRACIDRTISESTNLIIDGVSIVPGMIDTQAYSDRADIFVLVVATLDEDALRTRFAARAAGQSRRAAHRYLENLDGILAVQRHLLELAEEHDVPIVNNVSVDESVRQIIAYLMDGLQRAQASRPPATSGGL